MVLFFVLFMELFNILPCYIMTDEQLDKVYKTIEEAIQMLEDKQLL